MFNSIFVFMAREYLLRINKIYPKLFLSEIVIKITNFAKIKTNS